ncbi:helix-turn-helix domain-containing protein [Wolbachia endosymbiont of Ctenocephalides felis wCfeT]|uniref:helix-turn-helix domain-containing protein n=1 Tax=Wolbachia endosymbiont of Ctenocephalides felis wCfeT TaxID=2732593 RepID=UPI001445F3C2|nr:XRE family transcriptional regulator [Wolbachia endosymbiont of Ctenocephalides felis wCfeT]
MVKKIRANDDNVKKELLSIVKSAIRENGLTQKEAAKVLETDQPKMSAIVNLRTKGLSLEKIFMFLSLLGYEVEIVVRKTNLN